MPTTGGSHSARKAEQHRPPALIGLWIAELSWALPEGRSSGSRRDVIRGDVVAASWPRQGPAAPRGWQASLASGGTRFQAQERRRRVQHLA